MIHRQSEDVFHLRPLLSQVSTCLPVSTGDNAANARIVEALASVSTGDNAVNARTVEALKSVSTGDNAVNARLVEALASVSTGDNAVDARLVEAAASVVERSEREAKAKCRHRRLQRCSFH